MTPIRTLIVDDEPHSLAMMTGYLQEYTPEVEVVGTAKSAAEAAEQILKLQPELLFLDISMPGESGLDLLKRFKDPNFEIVFVTAHKNFALEAFEQGALHYLLKPIDIVKLKDAVTRTSRVIAQKQSSENTAKTEDVSRITVSDSNGHQVLKLAEIAYFEAEGSYTLIRLQDGRKFTSSNHLGYYEQRLADKGFFRTHRQYLVNLSVVTSYSKGKGGYVTLVDGTQIELSYRKKAEFLERLGGLTLPE